MDLSQLSTSPGGPAKTSSVSSCNAVTSTASLFLISSASNCSYCFLISVSFSAASNSANCVPSATLIFDRCKRTERAGDVGRCVLSALSANSSLSLSSGCMVRSGGATAACSSPLLRLLSGEVGGSSERRLCRSISTRCASLARLCSSASPWLLVKTIF